MESIGCLLDDDAGFAVRLCDSFNNSARLPYKMRAFSDVELLLSCMDSYRVRLLIIASSVGEDVFDVDKISDKASKIVYLEDAACPVSSSIRERFKIIEKYQAVDDILNAICVESCEKENYIGVRKIYGVYSPNGKVYKTTLCEYLSQALSSRGKVLLLCLSEFAGEDFSKKNLSDAMYFYKQNKERIGEAVETKDGYDYIPAAACIDDMDIVGGDELAEMLEYLLQINNYSSVVIDIGNYIRPLGKVFSLCNRIFIPTAKDDHEQARISEFKNYMAQSDYKEYASVFVDVNIEYDSNFKKVNGTAKSSVMERLVSLLEL